MLLAALALSVQTPPARYTPAHNARGEPIESFDGDYTINWRLP